ncbi:hypothetical protein DAEQUDRAFT_102301 [Daedalea quercina L-15889]|uniref:Uncharacterized protein n=1 Tax=Daedalea quercina L-15889 TaxID=1314783 RepID=A0A165KVB0_9APHY|nr:hypothetical protein DAEQUDRAFT_102301 [Daedalea quercina L-15889]
MMRRRQRLRGPHRVRLAAFEQVYTSSRSRGPCGLCRSVAKASWSPSWRTPNVDLLAPAHQTSYDVNREWPGGRVPSRCARAQREHHSQPEHGRRAHDLPREYAAQIRVHRAEHVVLLHPAREPPVGLHLHHDRGDPVLRERRPEHARDDEVDAALVVTADEGGPAPHREPQISTSG